MAPSLDHVGFFTADVESAKLAASVLCKGWNQDAAVSHPVFGIPEGPYLKKTSKEGLKYFRRTCSRLCEAGFEVRSVEMLKDFDDIVRRNGLLMAAEAAQVHKEWFRNYSDRYHEKTAELIREGEGVQPNILDDCRAGRGKLREEIMRIMNRYGLSALLAPASVGPAPHGLGSTGDPVMNLPWTHAGLPAISLPSGKTSKGLPIGLQVVGSWMNDEVLLGLAQHFETVIGS